MRTDLMPAYQVARRAIIDYHRSPASQLESPDGDVLEQADQPGPGTGCLQTAGMRSTR